MATNNNKPSLPGPGNITRVVLDNGITILVYENFAAQSVVNTGAVRAGSLYEAPEKNGLGAMTASALLRGTNNRERNTGSAAGRLDHFDTRLEQTLLFGVPDHRGTNAAFDRISRVARLDFCQDGGFRVADDMVQFHQGGVADRLRVVCVDFAHDFSFRVCLPL